MLQSESLSKKLRDMTTEISRLKVFVDDKFEKEIMDNVIQKVFSSLDAMHQNILLKYLVNMINVIALTFGFRLKNRVIYEYQFRQNNYRDVIALLLMLLPFINDDSGEKKKHIKKLDEIFTKKDIDVDINYDQPRYTYSNIQYNRCIRSQIIKEKPFHMEFLDHNYKLLLETIRISSSRLHVNWIDIIPVDMANYKKTEQYVNTSNVFNKKELNDWDPYKDTFLDEKSADMLKIMSMHDIYDTITNEFYYNILGIKWLIYDIKTLGGDHVPMLIICSYLFNLNKCIDNIEWKALTDEEREIFSSEWNEFITSVYGNINFAHKNLYIPNSSLQKIARSLIFNFDNNYETGDAIKKGEYKPFDPNKQYNYDEFDENDNENDDEETTEQQNYTIDMLKESITTLYAEHIYEYIKQSIQKFKNTWYAKYLFNERGILSYDEYQPIETNYIDMTGGVFPSLTIKNVYNFSKSLVHTFAKGKKQLVFPRFWKMLSQTERTIILDRLNGKNVLSWFNISRYIRTTYFHEDDISTYDKKDFNKAINGLNILIYDLVQKNMIDFIFQSMILRGILSHFLPAKILSDERYISKDTRSKVAQIVGSTILNKTNTLWSDSYSYITGTSYQSMKYMTYTDRVTKTKQFSDYFTYNSRSAWYDGYALNWISQINFFHKYLNNRVIFVTGATGVGKSTLVPILLMYALKAIDFNNKGSVACTEPRIAPTRKNASILAEQLGVSINDNNIDNNYYIQYKFKGVDETKSVEHLLLKIITDGGLLQEIQNPFFKKVRIREKVINNVLKQKIYYRKENQYDILIVDESHEHNKNMDLILTLMKQCTNYNNTIKLVIISATMDDDEPYYRRFYRDINDNRIYPFNAKLSEYKIDRINVDRRLHISPPAETTRFIITEKYEPDVDPFVIINKVVTESAGDILFFQPGVKEITATVDKLNATLPPNMIALPFYSQLNNYQRETIENISDELKNIRIDRRTPFNEFSRLTNFGRNMYNRCVIVATNIAEASLTISSLTTVVDTGTQKVSIYDYKSHGATLSSSWISESSRQQRKGRVGRTGPGNVYYLYPKGTTEFIKKQYDISVSDIFSELYDRLYDDNNDLCLISSEKDPNSYNNITNKIFNVLNKKSLQKMFTYKNEHCEVINVDKIILQQYYTNGIFYDYYGNDNHYDYKNYSHTVTSYQTGFSYDSLNDEHGIFYIIHPNEPDFIRNINGTIINLISTKHNKPDIRFIESLSENKSNNKILSQKMISFWNSMMDNLLLSIKMQSTVINHNQTISYFTKKTELGKQMSLLKQELGEINIEKVNYPFVLTLLYGISLGVSKSIKRLLALYLASNGNVFTSFITGAIIGGKYKFTNLKQIKNYFGDSSSDIDSMLYFINDLHDMLTREEIIIDPTSDEVIKPIKSIKTNVVFKIETNKPLELIEEKMKNLIDKEKISNSKDLNQLEKETLIKENFNTKYIEHQIKIHENKIIRWAQNRSINPNIVMNYLSNYCNTLNVLYKIDNGMIKSKVNINDSCAIIKKSLPQITEISNLNEKNEELFMVTLAFMFGYKYNIVKHISNNYYVNIYSMERNSITSLKKTAFFYNLTFDKNLKNYLLYLSENVENSTIECVSSISPALIRYLGHIYSNDFIKYRESIVMNQYIQNNQNNQDNDDDDDNETMKKNIEIVGSYKNTINEIVYDVISYHDYNIWNNLREIYNDDEYIDTRKKVDINYTENSSFIVKLFENT